MPEQPKDSRTIQEQLRAIADRAALDAVIRHSELRGIEAVRVARHAVTAAAPGLRAQYANQLANTSEQELITVGLLAVAGLAAETVALGTLFARGGRKSRLLAAGALATHAWIIAYGQRRKRLAIAGARESAAAAGEVDE